MSNENLFLLLTALRIAKLFGLFPINIDSRNPQNIRFRWRSLRTFFSLIFVFGSGVTTIAILKSQTAAGPLTMRNIIGIVFFGGCFVNCILLFKIAQRFDILMVHWMAVESQLSDDELQLNSNKKSIYKRVKLTTILYLSASLLEHLLYFSSEINNLVYVMHECNISVTYFRYLEIVISRNLKFVVDILPWSYNRILGISLEYLNISYTFFWDFIDLFIILTSIGISFLYEKLNLRLQQCKGLLMSETFWTKTREQHAQVFDLLRFVNTLMGEVVIFAFFIDGYFLLMQLLNITM